MRINIVVSVIDRSGGFKVVATLSRLLVERGHEVNLIVNQLNKSSLSGKLKNWIVDRRFVKKNELSMYSVSIPFTLADNRRLLNPSDVPDADVVIGTWWRTMEFVKDLPPEKGEKIHFVQDYEVWGREGAAPVDRILQLQLPKITISAFLLNLLTGKFGNKEVYLLPNAVDHDIFFSPLRRKGSPTTVGFTYTHDPRKGSDLILKAVALARMSYPALKVVAFSHGPPQPSIPVPAWVDFHVAPNPEEIRKIYSACDAWLFGSRREGFGLPILEAMSCRTPVIGTPAGAAPELLSHGAGILVGDQDWEGMARAILDVTRMPNDEWLGLSQRAFRRAEENQWTTVAEKLENILTGLIKRPLAVLAS